MTPAERDADALATRALAPSSQPQSRRQIPESVFAASGTGSGAPLAPAIRHDFESRFGHDLRHVRVHTDSRAAASARAVDAAAYTVGPDLVFGEGRYAPGTGAGRRLLAHELAHVVRKSPPQILARQPADAHLAGASTDTRVPTVPFRQYVDAYADVIYQLSYKMRGQAASTLLRVRYPDGTVIEIDIYRFDDKPMTSQEFRDSLAHAHLGEGGRIFPLRLTRRTTPRLWAARQVAIETIENHNIDFMGLAIAGAMQVITLPAMPAGEPLGGGGGATPSDRPPDSEGPSGRAARLRGARLGAAGDGDAGGRDTNRRRPPPRTRADPGRGPSWGHPIASRVGGGRGGRPSDGAR